MYPCDGRRSSVRFSKDENESVPGDGLCGKRGAPDEVREEFRIDEGG